MANILYGVNGEGSGHASRSREILSHLEDRGHSVHVVSFDRGLKNLAADFSVTEIFGLCLAYSDNQVRYRRTVFKNLLAVRGAAESVRTVHRLTEEWKTQLVITDFEPISCQVAHSLQLPIISIDNQHALINCEIAYPRQYHKEATAAKIVSRLMTPRADAYLVTSFFKARIKDTRTFLFPPILRKEVLDSHAVDGEAVVVYVTSASNELTKVLRGIRQRFICYGFNREGQEGNLLFKKPSAKSFLEDLKAAKAVVANSGFSLISEALFLGKPYLAWPVKRQFEQIFNAYYVQEMGYGAYWDDLNRERIESFLFNLEHYRENLAKYAREDNSTLFAKLDDLIGKYTQ